MNARRGSSVRTTPHFSEPALPAPVLSECDGPNYIRYLYQIFSSDLYLMYHKLICKSRSVVIIILMVICIQYFPPRIFPPREKFTGLVKPFFLGDSY